VRKNNFSNSFGNDQECLFFQGSVCYRPGTIAEVIFAHCLSWAERTAGLLQWKGDPELLQRIAEGDEFSILEST